MEEAVLAFETRTAPGPKSYLRGSETVVRGLRTAVRVVTYRPEIADRCGPLGALRFAIVIFLRWRRRPRPCLALPS